MTKVSPCEDVSELTLLSMNVQMWSESVTCFGTGFQDDSGNSLNLPAVVVSPTFVNTRRQACGSSEEEAKGEYVGAGEDAVDSRDKWEDPTNITCSGVMLPYYALPLLLSQNTRIIVDEFIAGEFKVPNWIREHVNEV